MANTDEMGLPPDLARLYHLLSRDLTSGFQALVAGIESRMDRVERDISDVRSAIEALDSEHRRLRRGLHALEDDIQHARFGAAEGPASQGPPLQVRRASIMNAGIADLRPDFDF